MTGFNKLSSVLLALSAIAAAGCQSSDKEIPADAIACVGSSYLTRGELSRHVPGGLPPSDSAAYAKAYIRNWIDARLIATVAAREIDMDEIDRLTAEYRTELIMSQYRRTMAIQATDGIFSEDSLRAYYDRHPDEFTLERPLVRGIYLKVPSDAPNLGTLRRLYTSSKSEDMDRLEKEAPAAAIHYDYFRDLGRLGANRNPNTGRHTVADIVPAFAPTARRDQRRLHLPPEHQRIYTRRGYYAF